MFFFGRFPSFFFNSGCVVLFLYRCGADSSTVESTVTPKDPNTALLVHFHKKIIYSVHLCKWNTDKHMLVLFSVNFLISCLPRSSSYFLALHNLSRAMVTQKSVCSV